MGKELSEMTLEELWELFPIFLVEPSDKWASSYNKIESALRKGLSECPVERISHIGSTAIHGIWAKDIIDILIEISTNSDMETTAKVVEENGFIRMASAKNRDAYTEAKTEFVRKWTSEARKVYHGRY